MVFEVCHWLTKIATLRPSLPHSPYLVEKLRGRGGWGGVCDTAGGGNWVGVREGVKERGAVGKEK